MAIRLEVIGNLGRDAEVKDINGRQWLSFSVAPSRAKGDGETMWVSCLYGNIKLKQWLTKGKTVFVRGRYADGLYTGKDGRTGIDRKLFVDDLDLLGGGDGSGRDPFVAGAESLERRNNMWQDGTVRQAPPVQTAQPAAPAVNALGDDNDDDLPF